LSAARHKAVVEHATRRRLVRLTAPALAATLVTGTVVGVSLAAADMNPSEVAASNIAGQVGRPSQAQIAEDLLDRQQSVNRSARRVTLAERPEPIGFRYATVALNLRAEPSEQAKVVDVLDVASKIAITGKTEKGFAEVARDGVAYWVSADYLAKKKPKPEKEEAAATGVTPGNCTASPPSGVVSQAMVVFEAVCSNFPSITTYGGWRNDGEHSDGHAIDVMVSGDEGWQVAEFLRAHAAEFNLYDVIYSQRIFTQERASEGWRYMEDRGSTTANHYDHVHVAVY
jgi:SH3 domain-containing protein